jgi:hypothetical protein
MNVGFDVLRDNGLRLDPAFTLAVKAMMQAEVIATTLEPGGGMLTRGYEIAERLLRERLTAESVVQLGGQGAEGMLLDLSRHAPALQEVAQHLLGDERTVAITHPTPQPLAAAAPSGHGTAAILLAGLLIGTAIVASSGSTPQGWSWIRDLASVGFVVTLVASGLLLAGVVRRLRRDANDR